jgi:hypothetical protein
MTTEDIPLDELLATLADRFEFIDIKFRKNVGVWVRIAPSVVRKEARETIQPTLDAAVRQLSAVLGVETKR